MKKVIKMNRSNRKLFIEHHISRNKIVQIMVLNAKGRSSAWKGKASGMVVGWFDDAIKLNSVITKLNNEKPAYENVFMSTHKPTQKYSPPIKTNHLVTHKSDGLLKDKNIANYSYIFIDIDPINKERPVSIEQRDECLQVRDKIRNKLKSIGFPEPISESTGNGGCLFYHVKEFENNKETRELVRKFLELLARKFNTDQVSIDTKVYNPARLCRVPGTLNRKRKRKGKVKYRLCRVDHYPDKLEAIGFKKFKKMMDHVVEKQQEHQLTGDIGPSHQNATSSSILDVEKYLSHHNVEVLKTKKIRGATYFCLNECVFDPSHTPNDSAIVQRKNGKLSYHCFHNSCQGNTWKNARLIISGKVSLAPFMSENKYKRSTNSYQNVSIIGADEIVKSNYTARPILKNLLGEGEGTIIVGRGGVGKSFLSLYIVKWTPLSRQNL